MSFIFLIILIIELCVGDGQGHNSTSIGFTSLSVNPFFGPGATTLLRLGANDAILVKRDFSANWWRLIVAGFLHVGVVHWLLNSITMWVVCRRMERWFGFWRVIIMFIFCSFGSQYLSSLARTHEVLSMGASGGICGLLGCIIADNIKNWHMIHLPKVQISYWIFQSLILFAFGFVPCFDNIAHTGGFISGVFIGFLLVPFVDSVVVPLCSSHRRITPTNSNLELQDKTSSLVSSPLNLMIPPSIRQQRQNFVESSFSASVETLVFVEADHQLADKNSNKPSTTPTTTTTITTIIESNPNLFHYIRIMYFFMIISGLALSILFIGGSVAMANHINVSSQSLCFLLWSVSC